MGHTHQDGIPNRGRLVLPLQRRRRHLPFPLHDRGVFVYIVRSGPGSNDLPNRAIRGGMMKKIRLLVSASALFFLLVVAGCSSVHVHTLPEDFEPTCIQGTVWYRSPEDGTRVLYPSAPVTAWRHGTRQALAETRADESGNYCIEVPMEEPGVDLRVFGIIRLSGRGFSCKGSQQNVNPGTTLKKCGEDCIRIDITAECQEFDPAYHRGI